MSNLTSSKQKILTCAVDLFAVNGYSETSVRDIATAAMIKPTSLYNHFSSKEEILICMMDDYANFTASMFNNPELSSTIEKSPTADGILSCITQSFVILEDKYYSNVIRVIFHEQFRNNIVRDFVAKITRNIEQFVENVFSELKKLNIISNDADPDYWKKTASSLFYSHIARTMLNIEQNRSDYDNMDLAGLLRYMFNTMFKLYGVRDNQAAPDQAMRGDI